MSSVTAVPLRPIEQGSIVRLWLGVAIVLVIALALAWGGTHKFETIKFKVISEGTGASPTSDDVAFISYTGKLANGTVFDQSPGAPLPVDGSIKGFSQALKRMKRGGHYEVTIPPSLGYGDRTMGPIPGGSTLDFDITLRDFMTMAQFKQAMEMQRQQQQQQMPHGAPGAAPGGAPDAGPGGAPDMPPGAAPAQ